MRNIKLIILHCSASSLPDQTADMIRNWHLQRGFSDIGYHWFIRTDGTLEKGRDENTIGAHCEGYNRFSIGICLAGLQVSDFTPAQFQTLRRVLRMLKSKYPKATLHGHKEFANKDCPVYNYNEWVKKWDSNTL